MMVFSEPNRTEPVLPPLPHWWVLMCTPHRKWKLTKKFIFSSKSFSLARAGLLCVWRNTVVCPQVWRGMAGEGTIRNRHQGDASSAIAKRESQEGCWPVLPWTQQWVITLVTIFTACWAAGVEGAVQGSGTIFMCENKISAIVTPFCMLITKVQAISASYRVCLGGHIPKPGLPIFMHCLALGM